MSRSTWAAAVLASVFALALTPPAALAASSTRAAHAVSAPASQAPLGPGASRRVSVLLTPGTGYQQPAGSGRVRVLQRRLAGLGFAPGPIDGRYGPLTTQAVKRFQSARRLTVDGVAGTHTLSALNAIPSARLLPGAGYQQPAGLGRVRVLQRVLAGLGLAPGPIDGRYGPFTMQAVKRFQTIHRLTVTGIVDASTLRDLNTARTGHVTAQRPTNRPVAQSRPVAGTHPSPVAGSAPAKHQPELSSVSPVLLVLVGLLALALMIVTLSYARARARARRSYALFSARLAQGRNAQAAEFPIAPIASSPRRLPAPHDPPAPEAHPIPEVDPVKEVHLVKEVHPVPLTGSALARRERSRSSRPLVPQMLMGLLALALAIISRSYGRARSKQGGRRQ